MSYPTSPTPTTIVTMGQTGAGKSTLCNNLLGAEGDFDVFPVGHGADSTTRHCQVEPVRCSSDGQDYRLIDMAGFCDSQLTPQEQLGLFSEFSSLLQGEVVFCLVTRGRWTRHVQESFELLKSMLGANALPRTLVVQTGVETDPSVYADVLRQSKVGQKWLPSFGGLECVNNKDFSDADRERIFAAIRQIRDKEEPWSKQAVEEAQIWQLEAKHALQKLSSEHRSAAAQRFEAFTCGRATCEEVDREIQQASGQQKQLAHTKMAAVAVGASTGTASGAVVGAIVGGLALKAAIGCGVGGAMLCKFATSKHCPPAVLEVLAAQVARGTRVPEEEHVETEEEPQCEFAQARAAAVLTQRRSEHVPESAGFVPFGSNCMAHMWSW